MKHRSNSEKRAERLRMLKSEEIQSYFDSKPENAIRKHMNDSKHRRPTTAVGRSAAMEIKQRCVIRVASSGIPASRADTERRNNARSKSERAVDPDERIP